MMKLPHNPNAQINPFSAPIPGQSWTQPRKSSPMQRPPQHVDPRKALEMIWAQITQPQTATRILLALKNGIPAETIARTLIFEGFMKGKWQPHLMLMIGRPVLHMIATIGHVKNIKNMKVLNKNMAHEKAVHGMVDIMTANKANKTSGGATSDNSPPVKPAGGTPFGGIMGGNS